VLVLNIDIVTAEGEDILARYWDEQAEKGLRNL
jgi:hypothetical protein